MRGCPTAILILLQYAFRSQPLLRRRGGATQHGQLVFCCPDTTILLGSRRLCGGRIVKTALLSQLTLSIQLPRRQSSCCCCCHYPSRRLGPHTPPQAREARPTRSPGTSRQAETAERAEQPSSTRAMVLTNLDRQALLLPPVILSAANKIFSLPRRLAAHYKPPPPRSCSTMWMVPPATTL